MTLLPGEQICSLTLKEPDKIAADDTFIFYFYPSKKIRLDVVNLLSNNQVLFSLKNNDKIFKTVVCCNCNWCLKD